MRAVRLMIPGHHPISNLSVYCSLAGGIWDAPPGPELVRDYYFSRNERLPQHRTESVLRQRMAALSGVQAYIGWQATKVEWDGEGARVRIARDGETRTLRVIS